ncbi:MAG: EAL domain-containing protein [Pseudomonadota bacterium]|nr:EAL domain-containing protein [Pseudomonadota bacterium]
MDSLSDPSNLLILTSKESEAQDLITALRNGGLAVHGRQADQPERLRELVGAGAFDLILCCQYDPGIDLNAALAIYKEIDADLPMIVVADEEADSTRLLDAMRGGVRDLAQRGDTEHLRLLVARELSDLAHRRNERHLRKQLDDCEKRATALVDSCVDAVAYVKEGMHVQANPAYQQLFRFSSLEDLDGFPLLDLIAPDHRDETRQCLRELGGHGDQSSPTLDLQCVRADDTRFDARVSVSPSNLDGEPCLRILIREQTEPKGEGAPAPIDADTGLPNRTALMQELGARLQAHNRDDGRFAVYYIGIKGFTKVVQQGGLCAALEAAAACGVSLREAVPPDSFLARISDDGFVLLVDGLEHREAMQLASEVGKEVHIPLHGGAEGDNSPGCVTGMMLAEPGADSVSDILNTVYRDYLFGAFASDAPGKPTGTAVAPGNSKHSGFHDEGNRLVSRIKQALRGEGFQLFYQPIVSLTESSEENYNVLLRLRDENQSLLTAQEFLDAAIGSGSMVAIDRWVISHVVAELAANRQRKKPIRFFVNLAEETLQEAGLLNWIGDALREFQAQGDRLIFQIQEEHVRRHSAAFSRLSEGLKKLKCRVALNRFGQGPSPEILLSHLSLDFVRFAPELIQGLADDDPKQRRLLELAELAREADVKSVVTGVEDARALAVLWSAGIDYVQGYFVQKPGPSTGT